jgi:hypothetical protein
MSKAGSSAEATCAPKARQVLESIRAILRAPICRTDRVCGKRLVAMIPTLLPALEQHGRLRLSVGEHTQLLTVSAAMLTKLSVAFNQKLLGNSDLVSNTAKRSCEEAGITVTLPTLYPDFETDDAIICRARDGTPVRVPRPEVLLTDAKREAAISFYEMLYKPTCN